MRTRACGGRASSSAAIAAPARPTIDPEALGRIVSHLDILALPRDQTKTVIVDGERREVAGRGDPQAMRAFLLEVLTGRRINEILLIDPEPLIPPPGIDACAEHDPEAFSSPGCATARPRSAARRTRSWSSARS
jgi:hypothetical protein